MDMISSAIFLLRMAASAQVLYPDPWAAKKSLATIITEERTVGKVLSKVEDDPLRHECRSNILAQETGFR